MQFILQYDSYEANPDFDWMVLIHGAGGSAQTWYKQIDDFKQHFNLLVVDLRDHGRSKVRDFIGHLEYTIHGIAKDVLNLLEHLKIEKCHFMGVSLGSVIIRAIEELKPQTVRSVVLVGGIFKINFKLNILLQSGIALSRVLPFHTLYKLLAHIVLPRNNHKNSRSVFIREAKKIRQEEFLNWLRITKGINQNLKRMFSQKLDVPYLIVMGSQDHVFLTPAIEYTKKYHGVFLEVIDRCGHVCNLERAKEFNQRTLQFFEEKFPRV
jgi:pimeloyl-ACP methyl ester carboxylesterase